MIKKKMYHRLLIGAVIMLILSWGKNTPTNSSAQSSFESGVSPSATCALNNIIGATYVEPTGEIVIIGTENPGETAIDQTYLRDNIIAAIRAEKFHHQPGVSLEVLDPSDPNFPELQRMDYFPTMIRDTHYGNMLAEADITLKVLSLGYDNETDAPLTINVGGYQSIVKRLENKSFPLTTWRIFISLKPQVRLTADGHNDIGFDPEHVIEVEWDYLTGSPEDPTVTAAVQGFIDHLNQNYDAYAAEFSKMGNPSLQETVELGKLMAIVRWLQDKQISIPISGGTVYELTFDSSPNLVPTIEVPIFGTLASEFEVQTTDTSIPGIGPFQLDIKPELFDTDDISPATIVLRGGVDFGGQNSYQDDDGTFEQIVTDVMAARVGNETTWSINCGSSIKADADNNLEPLNVSINNAAYTAIALPISGSLANVSIPVIMKNYTPPLCPSAGTLANWIADNQTGGLLHAELISDGSHNFPTGKTCWSGIQPGTYNYKITALGGPCQGAILTGVITFTSGGTKSTEYTCGG